MLLHQGQLLGELKLIRRFSLANPSAIQTIKTLIAKEVQQDLFIGEIIAVSPVSGTVDIIVKGSGIPLLRIPVLNSSFVPGLSVGQSAIVAKIENRYICLGAFGRDDWAAESWGSQAENFVWTKTSEGAGWQAIAASKGIHAIGYAVSSSSWSTTSSSFVAVTGLSVTLNLTKTCDVIVLHELAAANSTAYGHSRIYQNGSGVGNSHWCQTNYPGQEMAGTLLDYLPGVSAGSYTWQVYARQDGGGTLYLNSFSSRTSAGRILVVALEA